MQRVNLYTEQGGVTVVTAGVSSTTKVMGSFPGATITVFNAGTVVPASIFSDNLNPPTIKANPFVSDPTTGLAFFYAANGKYDIQISGTGFTTFTLADIGLNDPLQFITTPLVVAFNANPTFDLNLANWFLMTLTGNVASSAFSNAVTGSLIRLTFIQDGTGGRTVAWPASVLRPPAPNISANATSDFTLIYDGTNWRHFSSGDSASFGAPVLVPNGTALLPTMAFSSDPTTGWFRQAASVIGSAIAGVCRHLFNATGVLLGSGGGAGWSSNADPSAAVGDSFISRSAAGVLQIGTAIGNALGSLLLVAVNKLTITAPATGATLTIADGKTFKVDNTLELAGTDGVKHTFPATAPTGGVLAYGVPSKQTFTATGANTFTIPTGVTAVKVTVVGAGGAGGGGTAAISGGGGAGGGTAIKWLSGITPGNTIIATVGTGGTGVNGANGNPGGNSTLTSGTQAITTVTATGGNGGFAVGVGGAGNLPTNGDLNVLGSPGGNTLATTGSGVGGSTTLGGGGNPAGGNTVGNAGGQYGGGGSGGGGGVGNTVGGAGANGVIMFEWVA